jgi:preprotein translocase subunit SecF
VQLNHLNFEALQKEDLVKNLFNLFEPEKKAKYVFIPSNAIVREKKFPIGFAVGFFEKSPLIIDHIEFLQTKGLRVNIQFQNKAEAIEFKSKMENKLEKKDVNQEKIENKSTPNETNENQKANEKEVQSTQKNATNKNVRKTAMRKDTKTEKELTNPSPPTTLTSHINSKTTKTLASQKNQKSNNLSTTTQ